MADHGVVRRRREAPERFDYRRGLEQIGNFVDNELGNGRVPRRPDDSEWRIQRAKTIRMLKELRGKLDEICSGANYGKAAGNGAEICGSSGEIIGAIMSLFGLPAGQIVINVGGLVRHTGNFVDGFSNVVESLVSAKYLRHIEEVLRVDQELSRPLVQWLDFTNELDANIQEIFGVSLASESFNTTMKVFYELSKFVGSVNGFNATMMLMRQGRYSVFIGKDVLVEKLEKFFKECSSCPQLANRMRVALSILSVSTHLIQSFILGAQIIHFLKGTSSSVVPSLRGGLNPDIPTTMEVSVFCVFQAINMAVSVVSLINSANIIKNGKSKYSDAIKQLTHCLEAELKQMEEL